MVEVELRRRNPLSQNSHEKSPSPGEGLFSNVLFESDPVLRPDYPPGPGFSGNFK